MDTGYPLSLYVLPYGVRLVPHQEPGMSDERKTGLINLGAERLATALMGLAAYSMEADRMLDRLLSNAEDNLRHFRQQLDALVGERNFRDWREASAFAMELSAMLDDLKSGIDDPAEGLAMVAAFYASDRAVIESCDDSSGSVGDVFRNEAMELFVEFAQQCDDKDFVMDYILQLNDQDDYGLRDSLIYNAGRMLPEYRIRVMIERLQGFPDVSGSPDAPKIAYLSQKNAHLIEALARQIKDAALFERTRLRSWGRLNSAACVDIAEVHLESGDPEQAYQWLQKIPEGDDFKNIERDKLLEQIFRKQGKTAELTRLLHRKFREYRSLRTLQDLLDLVGEEQRDQLVAEETGIIMANPALNMADALFLAEAGTLDTAEEYVLARCSQLNGAYYTSLLPVANALEAGQRFLACSLIYRSLLLSILQRAYAKAYPYGIGYLRKLDSMASKIVDWRQFATHEQFRQQLVQDHGRKRSFWNR